jgi:NADP-dependent 3-hydroxy acid dehydrogenase YdfG
MNNIIVITGASSGFGAFAARALARAGQTVYASMRETTGPNATQVKEVGECATAHGVDLHAIDVHVLSQESTDAALKTMVPESRRIDVVVYNAGHMVFGPSEVFASDQLARYYETNVLNTRRVNRATLSHFRAQGKGIIK